MPSSAIGRGRINWPRISLWVIRSMRALVSGGRSDGLGPMRGGCPAFPPIFAIRPSAGEFVPSLVTPLPRRLLVPRGSEAMDEEEFVLFEFSGRAALEAFLSGSGPTTRFVALVFEEL